MRSVLYSIALLIAGCGGSKQIAVPVQEPPPLADRAQEPAAAVVPARPPKLVDATPEKAKGDPREAEFGKLAAGYYDAFLNTSAVFTADRKQVVFVSNRDGLP